MMLTRPTAFHQSLNALPVCLAFRLLSERTDSSVGGGRRKRQDRRGRGNQRGRQDQQGRGDQRRRRNQRGRRQPQSSATNAERAPQVLDDITMPLSTMTKNTNAWNGVKHKLRLSKDVDPTEAIPSPVQWNLLDVYDNRNFEIIRIEEVDSDRRRRAPGSKYLITNAEGKIVVEDVQSWVIHVQDRNRPDSEPIGLYLPHSPQQLKRTGVVRGGPLETHFCDEEAARRVGLQACERMNRLPLSISADEWNQAEQPPRAKRMVEIMSMKAISPTFDHSVLDAVWRSDGTTNTNDFGLAVHNVSSTYVSGKHKNLTWYANTYSFDSTLVVINFVPALLDAQKIKEELGDKVADWQYYKCQNVLDRGKFRGEAGLDEAQHEAGIIFMRYLQTQLLDRQFSLQSATAWVDRERIKFHAKESGLGFIKFHAKTTPGPCAGEAGWTIARAHHDITIQPLENIASLVKGGSLPNISIANRDPRLTAYVLQTMHLALAAGKGLFNAWQAGCVAADTVNVYMPSLINFAAILDVHCLCQTDLDRRKHSHYCMEDFRFVLCSDTVKLEDGRVVCKDCVAKSTDPKRAHVFTSRTITYQIDRACYQAVSRESQTKGVDFDWQLLYALRDHCRSSIISESAGTWQDGWNGERNVKDAVYRGVAVLGVQGFHYLIPHYLKPSPDTILAYLLEDGEIFIHHPRNVVLTTHSLNLLRGVHIASVLYWMRRAREEWVAERNGAPRNEKSWTEFHIAMDHAMLIRKKTFFDRARRLSQEADEASFIDFANHNRTSQFTGATDVVAFGVGSDFLSFQGISRFRQEDEAWLARGGRKDWPIWDDEVWQTIDRIHQEIRSSKEYNPNGLQVPVGPGGCPFPFLRAHMPDKTSAKDFRDFLCKEFTAKWRRMDEVCNRGYETKGSPMTLFLACLICWYSNGGKDQMFGCEMTFYVGHMCTYSVGRRPEVDPGVCMHDGFITDNPTSLADYVPEERTLTFQTAAANRVSYCYPKEYLDQLPDDILQHVRSQTEHYNTPLSNLPAFAFPRDITKRSGKFSVEDTLYDDFVGFSSLDGNVGGVRDADERSETGIDSRRGGLTLEGEIARFRRRIDRGERLRFNRAILALLETVRDRTVEQREAEAAVVTAEQQEQEAAEAESREPEIAHRTRYDALLHEREDLTGLTPELIIPLAKAKKDGTDAWYHDLTMDFLLTKGIENLTPEGTVVMPMVASNWLIGLDQDINFDLEGLGNPFNDTTTAHAVGTCRRVVMPYGDSSHYVVLLFIFDAEDDHGRIEYWNSMQGIREKPTGHYRRFRTHARRFAPFLARQPQVGRPDLTWDEAPIIMEQTQQSDANIDCGPLTINTCINVVLGRPTEIRSGRGRDQLVQNLRYRYLKFAFEAYMGVQSMEEYVEEHFNRQVEVEEDPGEQTEAEEQRQEQQRQEAKDREMEQERRKREAEKQRQEQEAEKQRKEQQRKEAEAAERRRNEEQQQSEKEAEQLPGSHDDAPPADTDAPAPELDEPPHVPGKESTIIGDIKRIDKRLAGMEKSNDNRFKQLDTSINTLNQSVGGLRSDLGKFRGEMVGQKTLQHKGPYQQGAQQKALQQKGSHQVTSTLRLTHRHNTTKHAFNAVDHGHPAYHYVVIADDNSDRHVGYPATGEPRGGFFTVGGLELASFDEAGNVFDVNTGARVGNFMGDYD